jgi:hypothetical protein
MDILKLSKKVILSALLYIFFPVMHLLRDQIYPDFYPIVNPFQKSLPKHYSLTIYTHVFPYSMSIWN